METKNKQDLAWKQKFATEIEEFRKKAGDNLALDGGGYLTYLAPTRVNLNLMEERHPEIRFLSTREH